MSSWSDLKKYKTGGFPLTYPRTVRTLYSPIDDVRGAIKELVSRATKLRVAMFTYSDPELDAILREKATGDFLMSLDDRLTGGTTEIELLKGWDQSLIGDKVVIGSSSRYHAISHLKIAVLDDLLTITGSTNWSVSGQRSQDNQLTVIRSKVHASEATARLEAIHAYMKAEMVTRKPWPRKSAPRQTIEF